MNYLLTAQVFFHPQYSRELKAFRNGVIVFISTGELYIRKKNNKKSPNCEYMKLNYIDLF